jgi:hypothetical protein
MYWHPSRWPTSLREHAWLQSTQYPAAQPLVRGGGRAGPAPVPVGATCHREPRDQAGPPRLRPRPVGLRRLLDPEAVNGPCCCRIWPLASLVVQPLHINKKRRRSKRKRRHKHRRSVVVQPLGHPWPPAAPGSQLPAAASSQARQHGRRGQRRLKRAAFPGVWGGGGGHVVLL